MNSISPIVPTLSDSELLNNFGRLRMREHETLLKLLVYLGEIDGRRLYLREGFASLFAYLVDGCGYSEGGANRRIQAARVMREYEEVYELLKNKELTLSTISYIAPILRENRDKAHEIIQEARGKKTAAVEKLVARYKEPVAPPRERVTVFVPKALEVNSSVASMPLFTNTISQVTAESAVENSAPPTLKPEMEAPRKEDPCYFKLQFVVDEATHAKLERVKVLLSGKYPKGASMAEMLGEVLDVYIEEHDPKVKVVKREKQPKPAKAPSPSTTRYIPVAVKEAVYLRDEGRCGYVSPTGKRCDCTWDLEFDHKDPFCRSHDNDPSNIRILCRTHNALMAREILGEDFMAQFSSSCSSSKSPPDRR